MEEAVTAVHPRISGKNGKMVKTHGSADTKFLAGTNIAACSFGPQGANHHEENEYVELESLSHYYEILKRLIVQE